MKIIHRYVLSLLLKNLLLSLVALVFLFLIFDFFDRIDNILAEGATIGTTLLYFLCKIPLMLSLMFPVALMASILFTIGLLSKSSEITAMRASGITVWSVAMPVFLTGLTLSGIAFGLNEVLVPYSQKKASEIYNIDIRKKDARGGYSQNDFWWRSGQKFFSVETFDSSTNELTGFSSFETSPDFEITRRTDAEKVRWVNKSLGWNMLGIKEFRFSPRSPEKGQGLSTAAPAIDQRSFHSLPLPIQETPNDFYEVKTDPYTMTISQLRRFVKRQRQNGLDVSGYLPSLYEKFSFPLVNFIIALVVVPFALRPARSGNMAASVLAGLVIGFSYYAVHSFSLALGKAELVPPALSAWLANIILGFVGTVLLLGAEAPQ
jgi:lipopolysaccharide export system permease protein